MILRRYYLEKINTRTWRLVPIRPPEPVWFFWTKRAAEVACARLNGGLAAIQATDRYQVRKFLRRPKRA